MSDALKRWQAKRNAQLSSPCSWLGLVGLCWLEPGLNAVGSATDAAVVLGEGPARLGNLCWAGETVFWQPVDGPEVVLETDRHGMPTTVDIERLSFFVVDRDGQLAVRIRDRDWALKTPFGGLEYFPFDPAWCIEAEWEVIDPPIAMEVPNVSGDLKAVEISRRAVFEVAGQQLTLLPISVGVNEAFFVFRDRTSGKETYGAGRFLTVLLNGSGRITLDFNFAYNPPCAFTPFATCPLPPPENWLPFAILAGEKKWSKPV